MSPSEDDFAALYVSTRDQILGYLLRRCSPSEDAADLLGETYLVAWRRRHDLPVGDEARLWLYGVARRVLANHDRGTQRRRDLGKRLRSQLRTADLLAPGPEEQDLDLLHQLRVALERLSEEDREIVQLAAWEELNTNQIAAVLGIRPGAARTRLQRARTRLRDHLEPQPGPPAHTYVVPAAP